MHGHGAIRAHMPNERRGAEGQTVKGSTARSWLASPLFIAARRCVREATKANHEDYKFIQGSVHALCTYRVGVLLRNSSTAVQADSARTSWQVD